MTGIVIGNLLSETRHCRKTSIHQCIERNPQCVDINIPDHLCDNHAVKKTTQEVFLARI